VAFEERSSSDESFMSFGSIIVQPVKKYQIALVAQGLAFITNTNTVWCWYFLLRDKIAAPTWRRRSLKRADDYCSMVR
jgi:hypothetical protein